MSDALTPAEVRLREAFATHRLDDCRDLLQKSDETPLLAPHPLARLLNMAERENRRADLLELVTYALQRRATDHRLYFLQASLSMQLGFLDDAEQAIQKALCLMPDHLPYLGLKAALETHRGHFNGALSTLRKMLEIKPEDTATMANIAHVTCITGPIEEGLKLYRKVILLQPNHAQMRLNYSIALLKAGYFQQGWSEHEWRFDLPGHTSLPLSRLLPNITSTLNLANKRILVTQEEGLGDTLMYLRYIPLLAERGAIVRVWGAETMSDLCARVEGVAEVQHGGETPPYDYHCPFISLPRAFAASPNAFGRAPPYLSAAPEKASQWRARLAHDRKVRVGLVWAGAPRPDNSDAFMLDQRRSMPLEALRPLSKLKNISLYSLQKGPASDQLNGSDFPLHNFMPETKTLDDTAALIDALDIVVSVDTAVLHLAGGMGKPVILMDRVNSCWRWMEGRRNSPWYPTLEIIRQNRALYWADVVERVCARLRERVKRLHDSS